MYKSLILLFLVWIFLTAFVQPSPVYAMDWTQEITDEGGVVPKIKNSAGKEVPLTLGLVASKALFTPAASDKEETGEAKYLRGSLGSKILTDPKYQPTIEELAVIKERIGKLWGPLIIKQSWDMIEEKNSSTPSPKNEDKPGRDVPVQD